MVPNLAKGNSNRDMNGIIRSVRKPSYTLARGSGKIRAVNRRKLWRLLSRLERRRNSKEASGVLAALLKGTAKEMSPFSNRVKYSIAMGLFRHLDGYSNISKRTEGLYGIWIKRIGQLKSSPLKERFVVRWEAILLYLEQGNIGGAHLAAISLMQEREFEHDPFSKMVVGWTFCFLCYSVMPEKFRLRVPAESYSAMELEISETTYNAVAKNSTEDDATYSREEVTSFRADSETSVRMDKEIVYNAIVDDSTETPADAEASDEYNFSISERTDKMPYMYTFDGPGLDSWLMPVRLSQSSRTECKNFLSSTGEKLNDYYKEAVAHLAAALHSSPPVYEAFIPLVQMLLLGGFHDEALNVLEKFAHSSRTVLPLRAKADLLEHIDKSNLLKLYSCYEDILKKDPTCCLSLSKLISLHQRGKYNTQQLLEAIALHLEASYPGSNIWKELASCFLKLWRCEEDHLSVSVGNNEGEIRQVSSLSYIAVPEFFTLGESGKSWKLRCKWWLCRHFSQTILRSDIKAGDLQLLAYKAASASYMYGKEVEYVAKACEYLEDKDRDLYLLLRINMQNSVGFFSNIHRRR